MSFVPFKARVPNIDGIASIDAFFDSMKHDYPSFVAEGHFRDVQKECLFVYRISGSDTSYTGLIAGIPPAAFIRHQVLPHEKTLTTKEDYMIKLLHRNEAMIKPVLLTHRPRPTLNNIYNRIINEQAPLIRLPLDDGKTWHEVWDIHNQEDMKAILGNSPQNYLIADGHHRVSSILRLVKDGSLPSDYGLLSVVLDCDQLHVHSFNRIINFDALVDTEGLLARLSQYGSLRAIPHSSNPSKKYQLCLGIGENWYTFDWDTSIIREKGLEHKVLLDTHLVNDIIIDQILGIKDIRNSDRISYRSSKDGWEDIPQGRDTDTLMIALHPIDIYDVFDIAEDGNVLPPKSTWFEPRVKNGVIIKPF